MGQLLFDVPDAARDFVTESLWKDAYVCGIEGVPFQSRNQFDGSRLTMSREISNSGKLYLTCRIPSVGYRTLSTCSLRCLEEEAHLLPLELARGSCHRARVQSDTWKRSGLVLSEEFLGLLEKGTEEFLVAASCRADLTKSSEASIRAIELLELAISELGKSYSLQSIKFRKQRETHLGTLIAATVIPPSPVGSATAEAFASAFNAAAVRLNWADIETDSGAFNFDHADQTINFCASHGQRIIGGPLVDFRSRLMPHWLYLFESDFDSFLKAAIHYVEVTVAKFRGRVQLWNCATGLNTPGPIPMDDEQTMRLAVGILQAVRRTDPNTPVVMSFDQPFGEYLGKDRDGLSPLHFADALIRSGLGMAGIGLECRFFYQQNATQPRSTVDFGQMIDRWATLGMPMLVQLSAPGGKGVSTAQAPNEVLEYAAGNRNYADDQLRIARPLIETLLAKHIVHGIVWEGWCDQDPHVMPHSGLIDHTGQRRPLLDYLAQVRSDLLT